jgi:DNA modification methylase
LSRIKPALNFPNHNTLYATHGLHAYAAKCPPQLVAYGLHYYSRPGDRILDPMYGSGTTLVEARIRGRHAVGYDIDPLAYLIARVKIHPLKDLAIEKVANDVTTRVEADINKLKLKRVPEAVRKRAIPPIFTNRDYWFLPEVAVVLALLASHIREADITEPMRDFLWVGFSSLILTKYSVSNARDIIHSRHHFCAHDTPPDVLERFKRRIKLMRSQMADLSRLNSLTPTAQVEARLGDARTFKLRAESIDLVFTSPPYATALDYCRAHFLAVPWMQDILGVNLVDYFQQSSRYIGSERGKLGREFQCSKRLEDFPETSRILKALGRRSIRQANLTQRYFLDMKQVLNKISYVLKDRRHAILVVCPSHIRKTRIPTHKVLIELGRENNLYLKRQYIRTIDARRRILPYMKSFGRRMSTEYVLIFQKRG